MSEPKLFVPNIVVDPNYFGPEILLDLTLGTHKFLWTLFFASNFVWTQNLFRPTNLFQPKSFWNQSFLDIQLFCITTNCFGLFLGPLPLRYFFGTHWKTFNPTTVDQKCLDPTFLSKYISDPILYLSKLKYCYPKIWLLET